MYYTRKLTSSVPPLSRAERPREKLMQNGASCLSDAELIAVVISHPQHQEDALAIASSLLETARGSLAELSQYLPEEFKSVSGVGDVRAATLCAAMELGRRIASAPAREKLLVDGPDVVAGLFMENMRYLKKEVLKVALIDVKNKLISIEDVSMGGLHSASFSPRDIFLEAIKRGAHGLIMAHNHPSGDPAPSSADISMTRQIAEGGRLLGIQVLDHIVIGDGQYISLRKEGFL